MKSMYWQVVSAGTYVHTALLQKFHWSLILEYAPPLELLAR